MFRRREITALWAVAKRNLCRCREFAHVNLAALEFDLAVDQCEYGVIATDADVETGVELRSALADDDAAGGYELTTIGFNAAILRIAVATVAG